MPSSVRSVFAAAGLEPGASVRWGSPIPASSSGPASGVYVVACTDDIDSTGSAPSVCPLSDSALEALLAARPELCVDSDRSDAGSLGGRLAGFWLPGEPIVYIGLAGPRKSRPREGELAKRVREYYATELGARSPHAGGWFLKTLSIIDALVVHYTYCERVNEAEQAMLNAFVDGVSADAKQGLHDIERVMPFANLEHPPGVRKRHGITGAKAARASGSTRREPGSSAASGSPGEEIAARDMSSPVVSPDGAVTQNISEGDLTSGIIRVPRAAKRIFPNEKGEVGVELRGEDIGQCRWDPRTGPDRERSGVLRIGKAAAGRLNKAERLAVEPTEGGVRLT